MNQFLRAALMAAAVIASGEASATYVVDTGAPTDVSGGVNVNLTQSIAARFTLATETLVRSAEGFIAGEGNGRGTVTIYGGGSTPGLQLFSANFATIAAAVPGAWQGVFNRNWLLAAGSYWIGFSTDTFNYMAHPAPRPLELDAFNNGGSWNTFEIGVGVRLSDTSRAAAVPEPASWTLMIAGFGVAGASLRRQRALAA